MPATFLTVEPAHVLRGRLRVPGDKSISHRYAMLSLLARGTTTIAGLATGADVASTVRMVSALGARVQRSEDGLVRITGRGGEGLREPVVDLDAGNSGTTLRLMAGILAGQPFVSRLIGDDSLSRRPMLRVIMPLNAMGAEITAAEGRPPLEIVGSPLYAIEWTTPVASAQVKSAVLLAGLHAAGTTRVHEPMATRDHTERAFPVFGLSISSQGLSHAVAGGQQAVAPAHTLEVPGDPSSAAVWAAAAAGIPGSRIQVDGVCLNPLRLGFLSALERMGASIEIQETSLGTGGESSGSLIVSHGPTRAATITREEVPALIDELPVLAASAALGGGLTVSGAAELRVKESDRITALVTGFHALGLAAEELPDGFVVPGGQRPEGGRADACGDHRLVMAFTIVALGARGPSIISGAESVAISYPGFAADLHTLAS